MAQGARSYSSAELGFKVWLVVNQALFIHGPRECVDFRIIVFTLIALHLKNKKNKKIAQQDELNIENIELNELKNIDWHFLPLISYYT